MFETESVAVRHEVRSCPVCSQQRLMGQNTEAGHA
jgi:hypothetical protein